MPHLTIQATANVVIKQPETLLRALNQALWDSGEFRQPNDIKARILPIEAFLVGVEDDEQTQGFVYVQLRLLAGRDEQVKQKLASALSETLKQHLMIHKSNRVSVQLCVEVLEIAQVYHKQLL
ncbi:5-carboxymethyl-2-hydroxymuconate Delta-isomerase [Psychrobacter sp. I-STPA6b]|uniref:5-carboxymethyl-2-hydroxymuconate Delta-isomerase n=1 Tax=Psychrobacter sp. I-STPA6b TaxID=2585718 RepID=UPI001D0C1367|nr:5-carboxymethyl-2-hydroxymuconate Delta-isomerase [Psychrobacter sp. I-STPA6b]